jgi:hypothetical protein
MPPRTIRSSRRRTTTEAAYDRPSTTTTISEGQLRHTLAHHAAFITIIWVVMLFLSLGVSLVLLKHNLEIRELYLAQGQMNDLDWKINQLEYRLDGGQTLVPPPPTAPAPKVTTPATWPTSTTSSSSSTLNWGSLANSSSVSPSGELHRGAVSPDGTKYAGYEETTKGKIGVAVELLNATEGRKIRYIVIFSLSESTGKGLPQESQMSVRWKSNSTIEYDVLVKKGTSWVKETRTVTIGF